MEQMKEEGTPARPITGALIPDKEVMFFVYEGPSVAAVGQLNERAGGPVSRIVKATAVGLATCPSLTLTGPPTTTVKVPYTTSRNATYTLGKRWEIKEDRQVRAC